MAPFLPNMNPTSDPNYLGFAQGTDAPKVDNRWGALFENSGKALDAGITGVDELLKHYSGKQTREAVEAERNSNFGVNEATLIAGLGVAPTDQKGPVHINPDGTVAGSPYETTPYSLGVGGQAKGAPPGVTKLGGTLQSLDEAYRSGELSPSYYYGRINATIAQVKNQFPGYEEHIDAVAEKTVGFNAANRLRESLLTDIDAKYRQANSAAAKFDTFLTHENTQKALAAYPGGMAQIRKDLQSGAMTPQTIFDHVANTWQRQGYLEQSEREIKASQAFNKNEGESWERIMTDRTSHFVSTTLATMNMSPAVKAVLDKVRNGTATGDEVQGLLGKLNEAQLQINSGVDAMLRGVDPADPSKPLFPDLKGRSPYAIINDATKTKGIREIADTQFSIIREAITSKKLNVLDNMADVNKYREDHTRNAMFKDQHYLNMHIMQRDNPALLEAALNKGQTSGQNMKTYEATANKIFNLDLVAPSAEPPKGMNEGTKPDPTLKTPAEQKNLIRQNVSTGVRMFLDPNARPENFTRAAEGLFGPGQENWLQKNIAIGSRPKAFLEYTSTKVTDRMLAVKAERPELFDSYTKWSERNFVSIHKGTVQTLQSQLEADPRVKLHWDPNANQITIEPANIRSNRVTRDIPRSVQEPVDQLNAAFRNIIPIYEAAYGKNEVGLRFMDNLRGMGINLDKQKGSEAQGAPNDTEYKAKPNVVPGAMENSVQGNTMRMRFDEETQQPSVKDFLTRTSDVVGDGTVNGVRPVPVGASDNPDGGNRRADTRNRVSGEMGGIESILGHGEWKAYPKVPGAKLAPDGNWYVKKDDQWHRIKFGQ